MNDRPLADAEALHDPYAALRVPNFRRYALGNLLAIFGMQMQTAAVMWEIYQRTSSEMALGLVGLVQVTPVLLFALIAGHVADRFNRKTVLITAMSVICVASLVLAALSYNRLPIWTMYVCLAVTGAARAFSQPAKSSFLPQLVPRAVFANAVTWSMGAFHLAAASGPAASGLLVAALGLPAVVYALDAVAALVFVVLLVGVRHEPGERNGEAMTLASLAAGFGFLRRSPVILGAISLDLFAVLLGGATTLLPVFAADILLVGPLKFGILQAAPAVGALVMALVIAHRPPMRRAGQALLTSVAGFGVATVVFGLSRDYWLSLAALVMTGALDTISVVVRHSLVQLLTPDGMRGRVSAVNGMFITASNELGGFESGALAWLAGPTFSVVFGGLGTLAVVAVVAAVCPPLRRYGRLAS